jgi:hypothetical protein
VDNLEPDALHQHWTDADLAIYNRIVTARLLHAPDRNPGGNPLHFHQSLPHRQPSVRQEKNTSYILGSMFAHEFRFLFWNQLASHFVLNQVVLQIVSLHYLCTLLSIRLSQMKFMIPKLEPQELELQAPLPDSQYLSFLSFCFQFMTIVLFFLFYYSLFSPFKFY